MKDLEAVFAEIASVTIEGGEWCTKNKALTLAALVIAARPKVAVEIGVWMGGSAIPIALAMQAIGHGRLDAIDPWAPSASVVDQDGENQAWWAIQDHEAALRAFVGRLEKHDLSAIVNVQRGRSDEIDPPSVIDLMHVDGNHGPQAIRDVERFAPRIPVGGHLILDDLRWAGGAVGRALEIATRMGFDLVTEIDTGALLKRTKVQ